MDAFTRTLQGRERGTNMTEEINRLLNKLDHDVSDILFDLVDENENLEGQVNELREQVARLTERGSALSENKGVWIYDEGIYNWRCSRCGQTPPPTGYAGKADFMATHFKFCSHCGAEIYVKEQEINTIRPKIEIPEKDKRRGD